MVLDHREAHTIYLRVRQTALQDLRRALFLAARRYAEFRAEWALGTPVERASLDRPRTRAHDAFIDSVNILSRAMVARGESIEWRRALGDDRQRIGDFACYIHCELGLSAR